MKINDLMTRNPVYCFTETRLQDAAAQMVQHDCGMLPVVKSDQSRIPVGTLTDRDIVCRTVARAHNPLEMRVKDVMTEDPICVRPMDSVEKCCALMEEHQVRRLLVIDEDGQCCGIVAQADLARALPPRETGDVVRSVSAQG